MYGTLIYHICIYIWYFVWQYGYTYVDQMDTSYYCRILILLEAQICWAATNFESALKPTGVCF